MKHGCLVFLTLLAVACGAGEAPPTSSSDDTGREPLASLRPLDDASAAGFMAEFDAARDRTRYVVALSPT